MMVDKDRISDLDIRPALYTMLRQSHAGEAQTVFIQELGICQGLARIDIAVVNKVLHGYEIKSDRDSLRRLPSQVEMYSKVVDKATIVVGYRPPGEVIVIGSRLVGCSKSRLGTRRSAIQAHTQRAL